MTEISLKINGIDCAACVGRLSRALSAHSGLISAQVSYAAQSAQILYDEAETDIAGIARCIKNAGYGVPTDTLSVKCENTEAALAALSSLGCAAQLESDEENGLVKAQLWPAGIDEDCIRSALGSDAEIVITRADTGSAGSASQTGLWRGAFCALFFSLPQLWDTAAAARMIFGALTLLGGAYFFRASVRAVRKKVLSPDIAAAVILLALYALCAAGKAHFLLLTAAVLLLLACRIAECRAVYALGASARRLSHMQPKTARVLQNGETAEKPADELRMGDILCVLPGERFAADGEIISGECTVDDSAVTGERELKAKRAGDTVLCGALLRAGEPRIKAVRTGKDSVLQRKISALCSPALPKAVSAAASALGMTAVFTLLLKGETAEK